MWTIERFDKLQHERSLFDCGHPVLNEWLQQRASQWDKKGLSRTYVAVENGKRQILGYYSLSSHAVEFAALDTSGSRGLPRMDVPVVLLGRLAVDLTQQRRGLGRFLLLDALNRIARLSETLGIRAVEVDAIDQSAKAFYVKYGFTTLLDDERHLFLPVSTLHQLELGPSN